MVKFLRASKCRTHAVGLFLLGMPLLAIMSACLPRGSNEAQLFGETAIPLEDGAAVSFETLKSAILIPAKCIRCHREYSTPAGVARDLIPGDPDRSLIYQVVVSGSMPQGLPALSNAKIALFRSYIVGLAVDTDPTPLPTPTPISTTPPVNPASWRRLQTTLIRRYCAACHNAKEVPTFDRETLGFVTKDDVVAEAKRIYRSLDRGRMPPPDDGLAAPPRALIDTFKSWMDQGFPD